MHLLLPTLALATSATALPTCSNCHTGPPLSSSTGFHLLARLANPSHDLVPSVQNWQLNAVHTGAGLNAAVFTADGGRLFYQNGTATSTETTILTDGGPPPFPFSLQVQKPGEARRIADVSVGLGTAARVDWEGVLRNGLGEGGRYLACAAVVPYYNVTYVTLQYEYGKLQGEGAVAEGCVAVELVAQCAVLNELPEGSLSSHEFAARVRCVA